MLHAKTLSSGKKIKVEATKYHEAVSKKSTKKIAKHEKKIRQSPDMGLEPMTLRLKV